MRLSLISAIATLGSVVMAQPVAQLAARGLPVRDQDIVQYLDAVTGIAEDIQAHAEAMKIINAPPTYHRILSDYRDIISITHSFQDRLKYSAPRTLSDRECTTVSGTYHTFATVNKEALDDLIDKAHYPTSVPFYEPMSRVLNSLQGVYGFVQVQLGGFYCPQATSIRSDGSDLGQTISQAIDAYKV